MNYDQHPQSLEDLYLLGMKRSVQLWVPPAGPSLEIGPGESPMPDTDYQLDYPEFDAEGDRLPYPDGSLAAIYAFHVLEHLSSPVHILREAQRVLMRNGVFTLMVPHYRGQMAFQDLDHKSFYTERTWEMLFNNPYYSKDKLGWQFTVHLNFMMAEFERNFALFTQLVRW